MNRTPLGYTPILYSREYILCIFLGELVYCLDSFSRLVEIDSTRTLRYHRLDTVMVRWYDAYQSCHTSSPEVVVLVFLLLHLMHHASIVI